MNVIENKMLVDDCWKHIESPSGIENMVQQPEHGGIDVFGSELFEGDEIAIDTDNFEELIWKPNLNQYCMEKLNFVFHNGVVLDRNWLVSFKESNLEKYLHEHYNFKFTQIN